MSSLQSGFLNLLARRYYRRVYPIWWETKSDRSYIVIINKDQIQAAILLFLS